MTDSDDDVEHSEKDMKEKSARNIVRSEDIFHNDRSLTIIHAESEYTLRITKQNKLILTK